MPILAGEIVTAGQLNRIQPVTYYAVCTGDLVGASTNGDVSGATITFTTSVTGAIYKAEAVFDFDTTGAGTTVVGIGMLVVDGSSQSGQALFQAGAATANDRSTASQQWRGVLTAIGSHTIKLQGTVPSNMKINATHTTLMVTISEVV